MRRNIELGLVVALMLLAFVALVGPTACSSARDPTGGASSAIINGDAESAPTVSDFVQVFVRGDPQLAAYSSGALLDGSHVLTCGHCLDNSQCARKSSDGNLARDCRVAPSAHSVRRDNGPYKLDYSAPVPTQRTPKWISVHPMYKPLENEGDPTYVDIAVLRLATTDEYNNVSSHTISQAKTLDVWTSKAAVTCHGFGFDTLAGGTHTLRSGDFIAAAADADLYAFSGGPCLVPNSTTIAGVMRNDHVDKNDAGDVIDVKDGAVVGAQAFRCWLEHVTDPDTIFDWNVDMPYLFGGLDGGFAGLDGVPDSLAVRKNVACSTLISPTGKCYSIKTLHTGSATDTACESFEIVYAPDLGQQVSGVDFVSGDFNQDGMPDFVGDMALIDQLDAGTSITHLQSYLAGITGDLTKFADQTKLPNPFSFVSNNYSRMFVRDFDGDGVDDLEGITSDGYVDTYYGCKGCTPGLTTQFALDAFPTGDRDDGKFIVLTGSGDGSYPSPRAKLEIGALPSSQQLVVEVFDGYYGSGWDLTYGNPGDYCFRLFADPKSDGTGTTPVQGFTPISASALKANEWAKLYHGAQDPNAQYKDATGNKGSYFYVLQVDPGNCAGTVQPPTDAVNAFKVRANDAILPGELSMWGFDRAGPAVRSNVAHPWYDSTFGDSDFDGGSYAGGTFTYSIYASPTTTCFELEEADADYAGDSDSVDGGSADGGSPYGGFGSDIVAPSKENVASNVYYRVYDDAGSVLFTNTDPSGQCTPSLGPICDHEISAKVNVTGDRMYFWKYFNLVAGNEIHIWPPLVPKECDASTKTASAAQAQAQASTATDVPPRLNYFGMKPRKTVPLAPAAPASAWQTTYAAKIPALLPIVLGRLNGCNKPEGGSAVVTSLAQALEILGGGKKNVPAKDEKASTLRAELLAAKLSLAAAAKGGEPLAAAYLYGSRASVTGAVANADDTLARACPGLVCPHELGCGVTGPNPVPPGLGGSDTATDADLQIATTLVSMINARRIDYRAP